MERDPKVFVMGEDIGKYGGIFSATGGLLDRFGPERIRDTPISESAFIGAATGAAAEGMRPIAELMVVDFFGVCMDQIYNHLAKNTYMSGGNLRLPVVLMTAIGGGYSVSTGSCSSHLCAGSGFPAFRFPTAVRWSSRLSRRCSTFSTHVAP
jgi:pyruvate dehydrogenase E1 component beta subunit